uniref:DUF148 domain-containing protein n=1 Tax=Rhabditophanes sp. KR3021 TaxID=114890 RepID=A0AC35TIF2_9BILA
MQFIFILALIVVPSFGAPIDNTVDVSADLRYKPYELVEKLSAAAKAGVDVIFKNPEQSRAALASALETLFTSSTVNDSDKALYATYKTEVADKQAKLVARIDAGIAAASLTDSQKALYATLKAIFENQNISEKQSEQDIEAASQNAPEADRLAVEKAVLEGLTKVSDF